MVIHEESIRYQLREHPSYSSLPAGLEIAVAPRCAIPRAEVNKEYIHKPLPPLPSKSPSRHLGHSGDSSPVDTSVSQRISTFPGTKRRRNRRGSVQEVRTVTGYISDVDTQRSEIKQVARYGNQFTDQAPLQLPELAELTDFDHYNHAETLSDIRRYMKPESSSSGSLYSQDNAIEDIIDDYRKWSSWAPSSGSQNLPVGHGMYLQPGMYSASDTELGRSSHSAYVRRPSRVSLDGAQPLQKSTKTLADLLIEERNRIRRDGPADHTRESSRSDVTASVHGKVLLKENVLRDPLENGDDIIKPRLPAKPLALRLRAFQEPHRSMSRFSDQSSEDERGIISSARDSVLSHICSIPSPFKPPSGPSIIFKGKAATSAIQISPPEHLKRKKGFPSGKYPLRSPFPFRSPLHKKSHTDVSPKPEGSGFVRLISDALAHFPNTRKSPITNSRFISNYTRTDSGPDTPMPSKPEFIGIQSPTGIFHKSTLQLQDAMQKVKRTARIRSMEERRRDRLRKKIVVVRTAEQSPDRPVTLWV